MQYQRHGPETPNSLFQCLASTSQERLIESPTADSYGFYKGKGLQSGSLASLMGSLSITRHSLHSVVSQAQSSLHKQAYPKVRPYPQSYSYCLQASSSKCSTTC